MRTSFLRLLFSLVWLLSNFKSRCLVYEIVCVYSDISASVLNTLDMDFASFAFFLISLGWFLKLSFVVLMAFGI